jgi:hypothetical protein
MGYYMYTIMEIYCMNKFCKKLFIFITNIIKGYISWIWYYLYKPYRKKRKELFSKRIKICESCQFFWKPARNCTLCGCFVDIKTKGEFKLDENGISRDGCIMKKW